MQDFSASSSPKRVSARTCALAGALAFLIIQLNFYFAWTSHVGQAAGAGGFFSGGGSTPVRSFLVSEVNDIVNVQLGIPGLSSLFTNLASGSAYNGGGHFGGGNLYGGGFGGFNGGGGHFGAGGFAFLGAPDTLVMRYFIDAEVVLFTLAVFAISLLLFRRSGFGVALLRAFEITSLAILPLGLEIFFFDRSEFNVHASDIQVLAGMAWFTNADVLYLSSAILGTAVLVEAMRYRNRKSVMEQVTAPHPSP